MKNKIYLMKGEGSFFIKIIYLILVIVSISLFLFQYISLNKRQNEMSSKIDVKLSAQNILNNIISSEECLAYKEDVKTGEVINEITHRILDLNKILNFEKAFSLYEPNCTKNYGYGYYIVIEKYNFTRLDRERDDIPPFEGKDVVIILDATKSMEDGGKIISAKDAAKSFMDCASKENRLGIVVTKDCGNIDIFETNGTKLVKIEENENDLKNFLESISTLGNTDLKNALSEAKEILENSDEPDRYKMILFLTDGCESCGSCSPKKERGYGNTMCSFYEDYCNSCEQGDKLCDLIDENFPDNLHIFTIGLFTGGCKAEEIYGGEQLKCISDKTKGKYYLATSTGRLASIFCQLGRGYEYAEDKKESWTIGSKTHSIEKSLKQSFSFSLPVSIRYNDTYIQAGKVTIYLFDGELEKLASLINQACVFGSIEDQIELSYKTYLKVENGFNNICMADGNVETCKTLICNKNIDFKVLMPGTYKLKLVSNKNYIKVVT